MALPTKIDPMLGYLTTGYQDHVRLRAKFDRKVNDRMWNFFQELQVIDKDGMPTDHFGDPLWVYGRYCQAKGDRRSAGELREEAKRQLAEVRGRGVFIATGHGATPGDLSPELEQSVRRIYEDAKDSIWTELKPSFIAAIPHGIHVTTQSKNREDYILHPELGEQLAVANEETILKLREQQRGHFDVQVVISDGLNAHSIMDEGHLHPYLDQLRDSLHAMGFKPAPDHLVVTMGRVRVGYRIGEKLFANLYGKRAILHVIGERPGTGHHTFSIYITAADGETWGESGTIDHNITEVVSGVATTALRPSAASVETARILQRVVRA
jgi:ethanolamine ammonia-lyase large subunit